MKYNQLVKAIDSASQQLLERAAGLTRKFVRHCLTFSPGQLRGALEFGHFGKADLPETV